MKAVEVIRISASIFSRFFCSLHAELHLSRPCPFGLEGLLADEIRALNADPDLIRSAKGGVSFAGGLELGMAVCLHSRFATRVLLRVAFDEYWDSRDVYALAKKTPWEKWFGTDTTFRIHSSANRCPLESLDFATLRIKDGLCDRFTELVGRRPSVEKRSPDVRIEAYFTFDHVSFYIDLAGESSLSAAGASSTAKPR